MKLIALILGGLTLTNCSLSCSSGQVLGPDNICIQPSYIEGCYKYLSPSSCQECSYRYQLQSDGSCKFAPQTFEPCCIEFDESTGCRTCNTGLILNAEKVCEEREIPGCLEKDGKGKCVNCATDFFLNQDGTCTFGIKNCKKYFDQSGSPSDCEECHEGYSLTNNNSCLRNKILGCAEEDYSNKICLQCLAPFKHQENRCNIDNCISYNDYGCVACDCGFYLNSQNVCEEMIEGCIRYQRGRCTDCSALYKLKAGICQIEGCLEKGGNGCQRCDGQYELTESGGCELENCETWDDGKCYACKGQYYLIKGECLKIENGPTLSLRVNSD